MNKNEFRSMVERYKNDLLKMAGLSVKATETNSMSQEEQDSTLSPEMTVENPPNAQPSQETDSVQEQNSGSFKLENNSPDLRTGDQVGIQQNNISQRSMDGFYDQGAPYTGNAAFDDSTNETYQQFVDKNQESGFLKVQAFIARQTMPVSGVKIVVSKKFSDMDKIFFEGVTDENGIIDNIELPAPAKILSERPEDVLPYAGYDFASSHSVYDTQNANQVQIFSGIKSIQPVVAVPK